MSNHLATAVQIGLLTFFACSLLGMAFMAWRRNREEAREAARAAIEKRIEQYVKRNRNPLPDMPARKLTEEEKQALTAWRISKGIRDNALSHYNDRESA